ncbi:MAG: histidinol-phosphate transaminase [Methylophilaceae bacterium]|nr:histidinol-phosphate transaminase [Methylophilaceae bacterium]
MNSIVIPKYINTILPYEGGRPIKEVARELGIPENDIVKLASNENPLGISPKAKKAIEDNIEEISRYPDGNAFYLKQAINKKFNIATNQIVLGNGSNDILELVARTFLSVNDEAIYSEHAFAVYSLVTQAVGAKGIEVPAKNYAHDLDQFLLAINENTKVIYIANPNNPTGTLIDKSTLKSFLDKVPNNIVVVLDEAYDEYLDNNLKSEAFDWIAKYKNLLISRSFSKAYGLAGLRLGYGVSSANLVEVINRIRQPFNVNSLAQIAGIASLDDDDFIVTSKKINDKGMKQLTNAFSSLGIEFIRSYGNFIAFKFKDELAAMMYYQHLLKNGIIIRPIANYKMPEFLRVSIGLELENDKFIKILSNCNI